MRQATGRSCGDEAHGPQLNRTHGTFRNRTAGETEANLPTSVFAMLRILDFNLKAIKNKPEKNMSNISKTLLDE